MKDNTRSKVEGVTVAQITPLSSDGKVDTQVSFEHGKLSKDLGARGIAAMGTTGECFGLDISHTKDLLPVLRDLKQLELNIIVGAMKYRKQEILAQMDAISGCEYIDAVLVAPPMREKLSWKELETLYLKEIPERVGNLIKIIYNFPAKTKVNFTANDLVDLKADAVKNSAGNIVLLEELAQESNTDIAYLQGNDARLKDALRIQREWTAYYDKWGLGQISGASNAPDILKLELRLIQHIEKGEYDKAEKLQTEVLNGQIFSQVLWPYSNKTGSDKCGRAEAPLLKAWLQAMFKQGLSDIDYPTNVCRDCRRVRGGLYNTVFDNAKRINSLTKRVLRGGY